MRIFVSVILSAVLCAAIPANVVFGKPDNIDGTNVPVGRIPQGISDSKYPRTFFPERRN